MEPKTPHSVPFTQLGISTLGPYESTILLPVPGDGNLAEWAERVVARGFQFEIYEHGERHIYMCVAPTEDWPDDELCHLIVVDQEPDILTAVAALIREAHAILFPGGEFQC
jgi:hypothetical protein